MLSFFFTLGCIAVFAIFIYSVFDLGPECTYPWGRSKKWWQPKQPFVEYDRSENYLTDESARSHIYLTKSGCMGTLTFAIMKSRSRYELSRWFEANKNEKGEVVIYD